MSRICVKNIPKYVKEDRLRDFFSVKGQVTDAKIMRTKDGKSRQFAFVGFRSEEEAEEALNFFDKTFMDTCRISCEIARKVGDPNMPRPWSRHSTKNGSYLDEKDKEKNDAKAHNPGFVDGKVKNLKGNENKDPQLQEFLQVMKPRVKSKMWANDTLDDANLVGSDGNAGEEEAQSPKVKKNQSVKNTKESQVTQETLSELVHDGSVETSSPSQSLESARDDVSDMDYFRSRIKKNWSDSDSDDEDLHNEDVVDKEKHSQKVDDKDYSDGSDDEDMENEKPRSLSHDEDTHTLETDRLFVRNLPYTANEDELRELSSKFGDVSQVHLVVDKDTKRSKGIAFIQYKVPECATRALEELDKSIFQGRLLHVMPAKPQNISEDKKSDQPAFQDNKNFKQQREEQRRASEASGDTRSWSSLFMRQDTVAENIARKHGISKSDLLDREADDLAVRIALGETHVIAETKKALSDAGVNVNVLDEYVAKRDGNSKRSDHVILVKNLPYCSSERDLADMFGKYGSVDKVILPPTRVLALVIFLEVSEARVAFKSLAYRRYKYVPLYLEWAPADILSPNLAAEKNEPKNVVGENNVKSVLLEQIVEGIPEEEIDPDRAESRTVFVKNLNFKTSDECLKKHFSDNMSKGSIKSVKVKKHIRNGNSVSMGFGFIEFDSVKTATSICKDLQGTVLDGHALMLQLCNAKKDYHVTRKDDKDKSSTKLIVRNVAFEATGKDLRQLFSPFGQIKSLRLPMKFGKHRGFAFVEFVTKQETQNAMQALSSTHLYGRHLVLERAKAGESLEELRERTAAHFVDEHSGFQKQLLNKRKPTDTMTGGTFKLRKIVD